MSSAEPSDQVESMGHKDGKEKTGCCVNDLGDGMLSDWVHSALAIGKEVVGGSWNQSEAKQALGEKVACRAQAPRPPLRPKARGPEGVPRWLVVGITLTAYQLKSAPGSSLTTARGLLAGAPGGPWASRRLGLISPGASQAPGLHLHPKNAQAYSFHGLYLLCGFDLSLKCSSSLFSAFQSSWL